MKVKTNKLTGVALDHAVAKAEGRTVYQSKSGRFMTANYGEFNHRHGTPWFTPSTSWGWGGPIIEREKMRIAHNFDEHIWEAGWDCHVSGWGDTPLIAAMRCYVASKLGDEVEVSNELA